MAAAQVAREYFEAVINERDFSAFDRLWHADGTWEAVGVHAPTDPRGAREFWTDTLASVPDLHVEIVDVVGDGDSAVVHWTMTGTFAGEKPWQGIAPTGAPLRFRGADVLGVRDGRIERLEGYTDTGVLSRQMGVLPPQGSAVETRLKQVANFRASLAAKHTASPEKVADGVWVLRGGFPTKSMNVFLVEDADGIVVFDAGIEAMTNAVALHGARMGGITKVVLGHAHADNRGAAPGLDAPVLCHEADRADAEGDGGLHYMHLERLKPLGRRLYGPLLRHWDGGPVEIAGTVAEGDEVAGFEVVHLPGHAPGLIGLWRRQDRLALCSDAFYLVDPDTGRPAPARVAHPAFNADTDQSRASIRKLAALDPAVAAPGHLGPLTSDVGEQLRRAADAP